MTTRLIWITLSFLVCLLVWAVVRLALPWTSPNAPRFVPLRSPPVGNYTSMDYDWGGAVPVQNGRVWIQATSGTTSSHCYLYDVTNRLVVGELLNASPIFFNRTQTKLLCEGYSLESAWKWKLTRWLNKFQLSKSLAQRINRIEEFWVVDLKDGSAKPVGSLSQFPGTGSRFLPSPGFRYGLNRPTTSLSGHEVFLCDLTSNRFTKITINGKLVGWWDEQTILLKDEGNSFVLMDVITRQTNTLFSAQATSKLLQKMGLPDDPADIGSFFNWNGRGYDFFFAVEKEKHSGESFLLKLDQSDRTLKLVKRKFAFHHLGFLDAEGTHYLYEGESGTPGNGGNGGVFVRDLSDDSVQTLVPPDNGGQYSLARFCGDSVIYWRKNVLWRIDLNGSNNAPLFQAGGFR